MPLFPMICGSWALKPKVSGSHPILARLPSLCSKYLCPNRNCLARDSPRIRFVSDSTHIPPTGSHSPLLTSLPISVKRSLSMSSSHL